MTKLRIGAVQFGVSNSIENNTKEIKKAVDWAHQSKCNFMITPEVALSGYAVSEYNIHTCDVYEKALADIVKYSASKGVGVMLGTLWLEDKDHIGIGGIRGKKYNQVRVYDTDGRFIDQVSKTHTISFDMDCIPGTKTPVITINHGGKTFKVGILICNDLAGNYWNGGDNLPKKIMEAQADVIVHCSNSSKDFFNPGEKELHDDFHSSVTRFMSYATNIPFISVDNLNNINGIKIDSGTSYPSGVYLPLKIEYSSPRSETDYFYYDIEKI